MRIQLDQARDFWSHSSQHVMGITPETLPDDGFEYWANGPVCCVFHAAHWPNVWMVHYGMKRDGIGRYVEPAKEILMEFWQQKQPDRIIGWTDTTNRAAIAFAKRCGFVKDGEMKLVTGTVAMTGWRP